MMRVWRVRQAGFTIVELLIVVVVIAILAAITIVAYSGVQQHAKNTAIVATADAWEKAVRLSGVNGETPPVAGTCLGKSNDYPAADGFAANECILVDGSNSGVLYSDAAFSGWVLTTRPVGRLPVVTYNLSGTILKGRGIWVFSHDIPSRTIVLAWIAQLDGACARGVPATTPITGSVAGGYCKLTITY
ncbi:MAG TPA: prepilin-type N-terminal cleavage/methylation domain-containing protein [Dongiaceae bacterium]|nr:prepilin-type N-terminal cleavage/methylation domain-containing protein [Dongiaceae bacterium]